MIPENTKAEVIAEYLIGVLSIAKLAKKYEVSERSITLWLRKSGIEIKKTNGSEPMMPNHASKNQHVNKCE